jgi:hypothetical protein
MQRFLGDRQNHSGALPDEEDGLVDEDDGQHLVLVLQGHGGNPVQVSLAVYVYLTH